MVMLQVPVVVVSYGGNSSHGGDGGDGVVRSRHRMSLGLQPPHERNCNAPL
jgi:hypothetical protein